MNANAEINLFWTRCDRSCTNTRGMSVAGEATSWGSMFPVAPPAPTPCRENGSDQFWADGTYLDQKYTNNG